MAGRTGKRLRKRAKRLSRALARAGDAISDLESYLLALSTTDRETFAATVAATDALDRIVAVTDTRRRRMLLLALALRNQTVTSVPGRIP